MKELRTCTAQHSWHASFSFTIITHTLSWLGPPLKPQQLPASLSSWHFFSCSASILQSSFMYFYFQPQQGQGCSGGLHTTPQYLYINRPAGSGKGSDKVGETVCFSPNCLIEQRWNYFCIPISLFSLELTDICWWLPLEPTTQTGWRLLFMHCTCSIELFSDCKCSSVPKDVETSHETNWS